MSGVAVKRDVLSWSIKRSGLTLDKLEKKFPKIQKWLNGDSQPTLRQLESVAKATLTPFGFLFLDEPPEEKLPIPYYRTVESDSLNKPSAELYETIRVMQSRQAWMHEYLVNRGQEKIPFVGSVNLDETTITVAERIRQSLGLDRDWASKQRTWEDALKNLREKMETAGILIVVNGVVGNNTHRKLDPSEFRGFVLVDNYAPLVFVNGVDGKAAQMFTLAHELGHIFLGSSAAFDLREMQPANDPTELACNKLAAEFLVPEKELRNLWLSVKNEPESFQKIARYFKVSALVGARRALDLDLIKKAEFLEFYEHYQNDIRRTKSDASGGGDFYKTQNMRVGRLFASSVTRATREGKLLYSEAYRLTGLYGEAFHNYTNSLKIGGSS